MTVTRELLEQALAETKEHGEASCVQTDKGRRVRIYALDHRAATACAGAVLIEREDMDAPGWVSQVWTVFGRATFAGDNLIPAKRRGTVWMIIIEDMTGRHHGWTYQSEDEARHSAPSYGNRIIAGPIAVQWEET